MNQHHFNVKEASYGALGNDTGNDAPAIQAAINDAQGAGGIVYLPAGRYRIASPLTIGKGVTLMGCGWEWGLRGTYLHVVNNAAMLANPVITVNNIGVRIQDFAIEHDQPPFGAGWTPTPYSFAIKCAATMPNLANDIMIGNLFLYNATKGIQFGDSANNIAVGRVRLWEIFRAGVRCRGAGRIRARL